RLGAPLRLLLAAPYLVFALQPVLPVAAAAVVLASVGYSASLLLQQRLMDLTPGELSGHALGLHPSCILRMQGRGAARAGARGCGGRVDLTRRGDGRDGSDLRRRYLVAGTWAAAQPHTSTAP